MENKIMDKSKSELTVETRAKDLCSYIMIVTQKCPKTLDICMYHGYKIFQ